MENLYKLLAYEREIRKRTDTICDLCKNQTENANHLFLSCPLARAVWLGSNIGLKEISFSKMVVHKGKSIIRDNVAWSSKDVLEMVSILWSIWFHQNGCCFKSYKPNPMQVLSKAKNCLFAFEPNVEQKDLSFTSRIRSFKLD